MSPTAMGRTAEESADLRKGMRFAAQRKGDAAIGMEPSREKRMKESSAGRRAAVAPLHVAEWIAGGLGANPRARRHWLRGS